MSEIEPFDFNGSDVRVLMIDREPWWVTADVCAVLGIVNARDAATRLDSDDVGSADVVDSAGRRNPNTNIVNESGLYELIIRSDKPEARVFRRWITSEVLPQIRETGRYAPADNDRARAVALARHVIALDEELSRAVGQLAIAAPKVESFDAYISAPDWTTNRDVAKILFPAVEEGPNTLLWHCEALGILYRNGADRHLTPYQEFVKYVRSHNVRGTGRARKRLFPEIQWSAEGVEWIYRKLRKAGVEVVRP